jgi:hypothetical protein
MKKVHNNIHVIVYSIISFLLYFKPVFSQSPNKMSYQAVIRSSTNELLYNRPVKIKINILKGSSTGTVIYTEIHSLITDARGLVNLIVGAGTQSSGNLSDINWGNDTYFLKTETDPNNGTNYTITGTSQLMSVPYAFYATQTKEKDKILIGGNQADTMEIPSYTDIYLSYDGGHNPWVRLPTPTASNNYLKSRSNTNLIVLCSSSWGFRILPNSSDLISELSLNSGECAIFTFDNERWRLISSSKNILPINGQEGQVLTMCGGYPNWGPCLPRLITYLTDVQSTTAISGGNIQYTGGQTILSRGVVWSTSPNPTIALATKTTDGSGNGTYTSNVTGLKSGTTYYLRAYATTSNGTGYGNQAIFKTK